LEKRWQALYKQIINAERDVEQLTLVAKFEEELQALTEARNEYQMWIDSSPSASSTIELQVELIIKIKIIIRCYPFVS
jgi:hypothetical protein